MSGWWTPARRRGVEILDNPDTPDDVRADAMADLVRSNKLFGGARAAIRPIRAIIPSLPHEFVAVDIGTGTGDIPHRMRLEAQRAGRRVTAIGLDQSEVLARSARQRVDAVVVGDALGIPLRTGSADVVICSQVLHHFFDDDARRVVAELHRVARGWVVIADLRRSWWPFVGFWLAAHALRFNRVTRLDGLTSVLRGFTPDELTRLVRDVTGVTPRVRRGVFWRLSATWRVTAR